MSTSTPRTDELAKREFVPDGIWIKHARELERELAKERARLDWLEKRGPWESWFQPAKEVSMLLRAPIREGIDAAIKEGGK